MKKHQFLNCICRLFAVTTVTSPTIKANEQAAVREYCLKAKQHRPPVPKRKRWATFAAGKKTCKTYNFKAADEWFAVPPINTQLTKHAECVYDEKVEMITPSKSTPPGSCEHQVNTQNPFLSSHTIPLQSEENCTTKTLIEDQKLQSKDRIPIAETIELASMVNYVLDEPFTVADSKVFDRDDFYDSLRKKP